MYPNVRKRKKSVYWIGIFTEALLLGFTSHALADQTQRGTSPILNQNQRDSANRNPSADHPHGSMSPYFDDEDDDDEDFFSRFPNQPGLHPGAHAPGGHPSAAYPNRPTGPGVNNSSAPNLRNPGSGFSGGGLNKSDGPDPIRTAKGISIGGQPPNGVISSGAVPTLKIDDESAEGSKEIVTDFNFPDADILDIAKTLGKLTGKNFILDKEIKGRVSIITNSPITVSQAWKLFLTSLDVNGLALVPSGAYLRIAKQRDARDKQIKTYTGDSSPDTDALITRVFSLKYISAEEVARTFRNIVPATSRIIPYEQTNTVIVTDTGSNISRMAKLLELLDVEGFDAGIEVIPVRYASAAELSKLIDTLIPGTGAGASIAGGAPGMPRMGGGRFNARRTKEGGIINTIIADERTNTLIVHANVKGTDQVRELVAKLDLKVPTSLGGGKVRVVYLQFADAEQVANTLNNFSTQSKAGGGGPMGGAGTGTNPIASSLFEGSIKISADKATNSLVITASPSDFVTVQRVINKLDILREQVYVEVALMEVAMERGFKFSANAGAPGAFLGSTPGGGADLNFLMAGPLGVLQNAGALVTLPFGGTTNYTTPTGQQLTGFPTAFAMVRAAQNNQAISVLATPQIIALDNTEAEFQSNEKIPIPTQNAVQGAGVSTGYGTKESITTSIKIKPQINKIINFVKMDVTVKLGDIDNSRVPANVQGNAVGVTERVSQTTVLVGDSDTVALGGLTRDKSSDQVVKIPLLGDIPIIGWLFKSKTTSVEKRNLLIFMTPRIVRQYEKVRAILDRKLKERDEFLEENTGGVDPLRYQRDKIIRSLPDIKELKEKHPPTTVNIEDDLAGPSGEPTPTQTPGAREVKPQVPAAPAAPETLPPPKDQSEASPAAKPEQTANTAPAKLQETSTQAPPVLNTEGMTPSRVPQNAPASAVVNSSATTPTPETPLESVPAPQPSVVPGLPAPAHGGKT